jgi:ABC-type transport system substrate-binding protein
MLRAAPSSGSIVAVIAGLMLSACGSRDDSTVNIVTIGNSRVLFETGPRLSAPAQLVQNATTEGLVGFDAEGRVIPALADRWIITQDGLSYIFRLRDGTWPDGSRITAGSAQTALRKAMAGLRASGFALDLAEIAEIRAMAGRVIEIRLATPMPNLLQLLAQPELGLAWQGKGNGPMKLRRDGNTAILIPIAPENRGLPTVPDWPSQARTIRLEALPAAAAVDRFNRGDADVLLGGGIEDFPLASAQGISRGTIKLDPVMGLFGLSVTRAEGFLAEPANREALSMAIDREALIAAFGLGGWTPATRIVAAGVEGDSGTIGERWSDLTLAQRQAEASARVARWRGSGQQGPRLSIVLPNGPGGDMLFTRLRSDMGAIGIDLRRVTAASQADLRLIDLVARYPRASWFLNQLSCAARRGLCSIMADRRTEQARRTADAAARAALYAEAEAELTLDNVFIPFGQPIRWSLVRGDISGFSVNRWGVHPLMPVAMRPR